MKITILGAGITGLAAACELLKGGHQVSLLEKQEHVGGLATTLKWKDHVMDYGAFVCYPQFKEQLPDAIVNELDLVPVRGISSQVYLNGTWTNWPIPIKKLCTDLGVTGCLMAAKDILSARLKYTNHKRIGNAEYYMKARIGHRLLQYSHLTEEIKKFTGAPASLLSPRFVTDHLFRFEELRLSRVLMRPFRTNTPQESAPVPMYPNGGIGTIPKLLETYLTQQGVQFFKGITINSIHHNGNRVSGVSFSNKGNLMFLDTDVLITTIPLHHTLKLMGKESTGLLTSRFLLLLFLIINKPSLTGFQLTYAFDESIPFKRSVEFKQYDPRNAPPDQTGVVAEICYPEDGLQPELPDIFNQVKKSLEHMGLLEPQQIVDYCFRISPHAYPVETLGFEKIRDQLLETITMDNLVSCGRQGIFRYSQLSFGWAMGTEVAKSINQGQLKKYHFLELADTFSYKRSIGG